LTPVAGRVVPAVGSAVAVGVPVGDAVVTGAPAVPADGWAVNGPDEGADDEVDACPPGDETPLQAATAKQAVMLKAVAVTPIRLVTFVMLRTFLRSARSG
jgi:hypothetical protein